MTEKMRSRGGTSSSSESSESLDVIQEAKERCKNLKEEAEKLRLSILRLGEAVNYNTDYPSRILIGAEASLLYYPEVFHLVLQEMRDSIKIWRRHKSGHPSEPFERAEKQLTKTEVAFNKYRGFDVAMSGMTSIDWEDKDKMEDKGDKGDDG